MANLTVMPGGRPPKPFSMSARGIAKFMIAGAYAARKVVESYAFPKEDKARKMLPVPAKDIVWNYFRQGRSEKVLDAAITAHEIAPAGETAFAKGRRRQALAVAKHLRNLGPKLDVQDVRYPRDMRMTVAGLAVRTSIDFICRTADGKVTAVIFNVAGEVSDNKDQVDHYARVESELAWQITRAEMPDVEQILYVDVLSEKIVRTHTKSHKGAWRNILTTCDNILIAYRIVIARRERQQRLQG